MSKERTNLRVIRAGEYDGENPPSVHDDVLIVVDEEGCMVGGLKNVTVREDDCGLVQEVTLTFVRELDNPKAPNA